MVTGVFRTAAAEKSPLRSATVGTVETWFLALRLCVAEMFRYTCHLSLVTSLGMRNGPPILPVKYSRPDEGLGRVCPLSENGAALRAELVTVMAMEPV